MEEHIGDQKDLEEAKKHIADVENLNDEGIITILSKLRERLLQDKLILEAIKPSSSRLITQFLVSQIISIFGVAERLLTAALDLSPIEIAQTNETDTVDDNEEGTGQYL